MLHPCTQVFCVALERLVADMTAFANLEVWCGRGDVWEGIYHNDEICSSRAVVQISHYM